MWKSDASSTSMPSAGRRTRKKSRPREKRDESLIKSGKAEVLSAPSNSRLAELYKTEAFRNEWSNDVSFHIASNVLYLRRYRRMSQAQVAAAMETSQSAIARIESGQENITLATLQRLTAALRGRFKVSIPPQELASEETQDWWESIPPGSSAGSWDVVAYAASRSPKFDRLLVGLQRPRDGYFADAGTHHGGVAAGLISDAITKSDKTIGMGDSAYGKK